MSNNHVKLVPILHKVLNDRFDKAGRFIFGWRWSLPVLFFSKKELRNFAHDVIDHAVYETSEAYEGKR